MSSQWYTLNLIVLSLIELSGKRSKSSGIGRARRVVLMIFEKLKRLVSLHFVQDRDVYLL